MATDFYAVLRVSRDASPEEIRTRFHQLARERHPDRRSPADKAVAEAEFQALSEAFNTLTDPRRRREYDLDMERSRAQHSGTGGAPR